MNHESGSMNHGLPEEQKMLAGILIDGKTPMDNLRGKGHYQTNRRAVEFY